MTALSENQAIDRVVDHKLDPDAFVESALWMVHHRSDGSLRESFADQYDRQGNLLSTSRIARARAARRQ